MPFRRASALLLSLFGSRLVAQAPQDTVVIAAARRAVRSDIGASGQPCAYVRNATVIFIKDSIVGRGEMNTAKGYLPFRVASSGIAACVSAGSPIAYAFDYSSVVRLKSNDFQEWKLDGSFIEKRPSTSKVGDANTTLAHFTVLYLREMVTEQEAYFSTHGKYTADLSDLAKLRAMEIPTTIEVLPKGSGWRATAEAPLVGVQCGVGMNTPNPVVLKANEGEPACRNK